MGDLGFIGFIGLTGSAAFVWVCKGLSGSLSLGVRCWGPQGWIWGLGFLGVSLLPPLYYRRMGSLGGSGL